VASRGAFPTVGTLRCVALAACTAALCAAPLRAQQDTSATELLVQVVIENGAARTLQGFARDSTVLLPLGAVFELMELDLTKSPVGMRFAGAVPPRGPRVVFDADLLQVTRGDSARPAARSQWLARDGELYVSAGLVAWGLGLTARMSWPDVQLVFGGTDRLPVVLRLQRDARRASLLRAAAEPPSAQAMAMGHVLADGAVLDWSLSAPSTDTWRSATLQLAAGAQVLGGGLEVMQQFQQSGSMPNGTRWSWTAAWPSHGWLRQARVGDVQGSGPEPRSIQGVVLSNAPYLRSADFGLDALAGQLPPGWEAELYRGGRLIAYSPADTARRFQLGVPISYGPNPVDVVLYGPHGEVVRNSRTFFVPSERLPSGRFEYAVGGGPCWADACDQAGNLDLRYGLTRRLTAEVGADYLAHDGRPGRAYPYALVSAGIIPAIGVTVQAVRDGLLRGRAEVDPGPDLHVGVEQTLFDTSSTSLFAGRVAGRFQTVADALWRPPVLGGALYFQGTLNRTSGAGQRHDVERVATSVQVAGARVSVGLRRDVTRIAGDTAVVQSGLDASVQTVLLGPGRLLRTTFVRAALQTACPAELTSCAHEVVQVSATIGRQILPYLRLDLGVGWQKGWKRPSVDLTLTTALRSLRAVSHNTWDQDANVTGTQVFEGSVLWDRRRHRAEFGNGRSLGRAGITGLVFFDANENGVRDPGEPGLADVVLRVGSRSVTTDSAGRFQAFDFVPFEPAIVEIDSLTLGDPTWVAAEPRQSVNPAPNSYRLVELAVVQGGEIEGRVTWTGHEGALGGLRVVFRDQATGRESATTTFSDGAFYAMGLRPGTYWVFVDLAQLDQLHVRSEPVNLTVGREHNGQVEGVTLHIEFAGSP